MSNSVEPAAITASAEEIQRKFDLGIWYTLFNWPDLTVAIQNQWGGPNSADKRDWLAGAISEIFAENPETDTEDIEVVLLQAMEDEFGVRIEDETEVPVARDILKIRQETLRGEFETVDALQKRWEERQGREVATGGVNVVEREQEGDWDSVDEESDEDEEMEDAPPLVPAQPKEKPERQIDEDGFEKVVRKGRR
ncbi:pre-rRNA-processing protein-like protein TSR2 [Westerdykella ornata]|uniref:Pre-rRNA-processing protein-like protein TSR2 n=1 Tax=Westerdykella ornata TaxID=318751 RepID=A0A6A6JXF2_WESOR|nr:pre-rRNA-processing protein-like protein TSR2 [Westerdykella ornata]KAF2279749.1 pre-rRNA-processing protein-like protein TSR2 [Westerdykella ornata]